MRRPPPLPPLPLVVFFHASWLDARIPNLLLLLQATLVEVSALVCVCMRPCFLFACTWPCAYVSCVCVQVQEVMEAQRSALSVLVPHLALFQQ